MGGERLRELAFTLEKMGEAGDLAESEISYEWLQKEWETLKAELLVKTV